ncbi:MAG: WcaI family glycosyltransferase, partial [Gemmatimonadaceae bacterium]|nr:WcaI family glycosyltransferase [Gloeobacterales cyanobacterium ES-bin-141]
TARLSGASSWLHIQDFELDAAFELGLLPKNGWFHKFATNMECWLLQRFDRVSSISVQMMSRLRTKNLSWERSVYFPNWVDTEQIYPLPRPSCLKVRLGFKENDQVVLYSGNMSSKQGLELMLEVAVQLANRSNVYFVLCGDGTARRRLESTAADLQLTNVRFLPLQPVEDLNELLNLADVHALVQRDIVADLVMPSKLTGMLASGRPVIATASAGTAIANVMSEADCGLIVRPGDPASFRAALEVMLANPDECRRWGDNGRNYVRMQFDKEQVLKAMTRQLTSYSPARGGAGHVPGNTTGARTPANFTREELLARISIDPDIYFGKPYIRGHYLWVSLVLDFLASGTTVEEILRRYPDLEETDVRACIAYGAEMARERRIQVSLASEE